MRNARVLALGTLSTLVGLSLGSLFAADFRRGDANADGTADISDSVVILGSLDIVLGEIDR